MLVSICIITYQRPEGLKQSISKIEQLEFKDIEPPQIEVVVVDNDVAGSAYEFCERIKPSFKWPIKCEIESQKGISYARNHAISAVSAAAKFIATIDDDEFPDAQWLEQLLLVQQKYDADIVAGPVLPIFPDKDVPTWVKEGKFFELQRYSTGQLMKIAFTGNVLVRAAILKKLDKPFDERLALTGGEDADLFMRLYRLGYQIVWADEAIVYEQIPKVRTNMKYILERAYRSWSIHSLLERELNPSLKIQFIRTIKGMGLIAFGLILLIPSLFQGKIAFIKTLRAIYRGCGTISGLRGILEEWV